MLRYIKLYIKFVSQYSKILMQSKVNFFIGLAGFLIAQASGLGFLYLVFNNIPSLNGWSFNEILFIYGFAQLPRGLDHLLTDNIWMFSMRIIVRGDFDRYLLRPINPLFQMISETLQADAFGELAVGFAIMAIACMNLKLKFTFINIIVLIIVIIAGAVIYTSIKLFFASLAFWIKTSIGILQIAYNISDFTKYPNSIYSKGIQFIITILIPFAFTAFIPAAYFIGRMNLTYALGGTCAVAVITFIISYATWLRGMRIYESAGN
ncbi:MAG: ABC-2 family transporter protein [Bacillota bacterium]|nr:ABC-2 family transporter protein [Bacillota bacterium]